MRTAIVYKTRFGSTKKYAKWLSETLKCGLYEMDAVKTSSLEKYDRLVVMSGTYAGSMPLVDFLKKNWKELGRKKIVMVAVGMLPEENLWSRINYWLIPGYVKNGAKYFKIRGEAKGSEPVKKENLKKVIDYMKR